MAREAERRDAMVTCGYQVLVGERQLAQAVKAHFSGWLCHPGILSRCAGVCGVGGGWTVAGRTRMGTPRARRAG